MTSLWQSGSVGETDRAVCGDRTSTHTQEQRMADGAPERLPVGVGVLLGPPVVRERDRRQRGRALPNNILRLGVDLAQLPHSDGRLGRQFRASLQQPAAALRLEPRGAQDQRRLAVERAQGLPECLGLGVLGAERCELGGRKLTHAGDLGADRCLRGFIGLGTD